MLRGCYEETAPVEFSINDLQKYKPNRKRFQIGLEKCYADMSYSFRGIGFRFQVVTKVVIKHSTTYSPYRSLFQ